MIYTFVDTNILVRTATQGRPGCEPERLKDLQALVADGVVKLVVPEVVVLEIEKHQLSLPKEMESNCDKLSSAVSKATEGTWNEIDALKHDVLDRIQEYKKTKISECAASMDAIAQFLRSEKVAQVPLSPEILVAAKRRVIAGRMPHCKKSSDQDALIVESLVHYFSAMGTPAATLLFCSENTTDFALELEAQELTRRFVLDPDIQTALPASTYSTSLDEMMRFAKGYEELPEPTNEAIEEAQRMRDQFDIEDEEFGRYQEVVVDELNKAYASEYEETHLSSVPDEVRAARNALHRRVQDLLAACRSCPTWSERSEYKLPSWIEYVDERMIPYTSLPKLARIRANLDRYLNVHQKMSEDSAGAMK